MRNKLKHIIGSNIGEGRLWGSRLAAIAGTALLLTASAASAQSERWSSEGKARVNQSTIGIAAGFTEGAPLRLTVELGRALDDGDKMRILPIVTRGVFENFGDLLQLRGVDAAIVFGDTLEHFQKVERVPGIADRVKYIANLFPSEMQIMVRPEINSIRDLAGKNVNFNSKGTAAAFTGPLVFEKLKINVNAKFDPHPAAMAAMKKSDDYAAIVFVTTKPVAPFAADWPPGFKLLSVPYTRELEDIYLPATLEAGDYPKLIKPGEKIETIAVPAVLAVYNWTPSSERYARMVRFVDYLFQRLPQLQKAPNDPAWKNVNLAASVPGWQRYAPVELKLKSLGLIK